MGQATIAPDPAVAPRRCAATVREMPNARFDHVDIVVTALERSLEFYRGLLGPLGWIEASEITGERGDTVIYLSPSHRGASALGLRERQSGGQTPYDRTPATTRCSSSTPTGSSSS
jgi:catechol 2,3-dioxygenase-like lactoylglutathione lyase family enzyme